MMMRGEDMMNDDRFWDVRAREQAEEDKLRREILAIEAQIEMADKATTIRNAPGFQDFVAAVQRMHATAREKLIGDNTLTDAGLREQRGSVRGLESVLYLLTKPIVQETLVQRLAERRQMLSEALLRRPKPKTEDQPKVPT